MQLYLSVLCTKDNEHTEEFYCSPSLSTSKLRYINPSLFFVLKKNIKQQQISHLLFEHPYYAWLIVLSKLFIKKPIIVHSHNIEYSRFKSLGKWWWRILKVYEGIAYKLADIIWFVTNEDAQQAASVFSLDKKKCITIPYGTEYQQAPNRPTIAEARAEICHKHHIDSKESILLFNGALNYKPNEDAVRYILTEILPQLQYTDTPYHFILCGKGLSDELQQILSQQAHVTYTGFVEVIETYFLACDIFLNPVIDGGGIKTKLVEALGAGKIAVSSRSGAHGVPIASTRRLLIVEDYDWNSFAETLSAAISNPTTSEHDQFHDRFYWGNIAYKAKESLSSLQR